MLVRRELPLPAATSGLPEALDLNERKIPPPLPWPALYLRQHSCPLGPHSLSLYKVRTRGFPDGSVVETPYFHCGGSGLIPSWGTKIWHATQYSQNIEK